MKHVICVLMKGILHLNSRIIFLLSNFISNNVAQRISILDFRLILNNECIS